MNYPHNRHNWMKIYSAAKWPANTVPFLIEATSEDGELMTQLRVTYGEALNKIEVPKHNRLIPGEIYQILNADGTRNIGVFTPRSDGRHYFRRGSLEMLLNESMQVRKLK